MNLFTLIARCLVTDPVFLNSPGHCTLSLRWCTHSTKTLGRHTSWPRPPGGRRGSSGCGEPRETPKQLLPVTVEARGGCGKGGGVKTVVRHSTLSPYNFGTAKSSSPCPLAAGCCVEQTVLFSPALFLQLSASVRRARGRTALATPPFLSRGAPFLSSRDLEV